MAHDIDDGPTFYGIIAQANALLQAVTQPSAEQEAAFRAVIDKLLPSSREAAPVSDVDAGDGDNGDGAD